MKKIKQLSILLIICLCMFMGKDYVSAVGAYSAVYDNHVGTITTQSWIDFVNTGDSLYHQYVGAIKIGETGVTQHSNFCLNKTHNYYGGVGYTYQKTYYNTGYACALLELKKEGNTQLLGKLGNNQGLNSLLDDSDYVTLQKLLWDYESKKDSACSTTLPQKSCKNSDTESTIKIGSTSGNEYTLIGNYYVSEKITVSYNGSNNYSINLSGGPAGTVVSESMNGSGVESSKSNSLYVKIPKESVNQSYNTIKLTLTPPSTQQTCTYYHAYVYSYAYLDDDCVNGNGVCGISDNYHSITGSLNQGSGTGFQHLAVLYYDESTKTEEIPANSVSTTLSIQTGSIEITKVNSENNRVIQGAKFKLYEEDGKTEAKYANGTLIGELTTDANGKITINNLLFANYILKEVASAEGYLKNEREYPIQVKDKSVVTIIITNNPVLTKISKKDIANEDELEGARIVITDEQGVVRAEYDSTKESHEVYLGPGKYKLKETVAPEGYDLVETVFEFEILKNGNVKLLSTESDYFKTDKNEIILYNKVTVVPVPDTFKTNMILSIIGTGLSVAGAIIVIITLRKRKINEI